MARSNKPGNCFICGQELGKTAMKGHLLKEHCSDEGDQETLVLKVEGAYDDRYWLYVDVADESTLSFLDSFLRDIWLECCGHLSAFSPSATSNEFNMKKTRFKDFKVGSMLLHEYDFGSTTETLVSFVSKGKRKRQRNVVRLLARNAPLTAVCSICGQSAAFICSSCMYDVDNPFFCEVCSKSHKHRGRLLPVTNSPRMGECSYEGVLDKFQFIPQNYKLKG
jgi:hypothetical protein